MRQIKHSYVCNKCGEEVDAMQNPPPAGWVFLKYGDLFHGMGDTYSIDLCSECWFSISSIIRKKLQFPFEESK